MVYGIPKGGRGRRWYIAHSLSNTIATVWAMQVERGNIEDESLLHRSLEVKQYLVKANLG